MQNTEPQWREWIGRTESSTATLTIYPMVAMAATLDKSSTRFQPGDTIPPLWHWLYFLETTAQSRLANDGHAVRGAFLPPISLPRRMWAGSRIEFLQPLHVGEVAERNSTIKDVSLKQGRSGELAFVTVEHSISGPNGVALKEQHDIVYREYAKPGAEPQTSEAAPPTSTFSKTVDPDEVLLFRYSALTFNAHRIHYDRDFARTAEAYPGLVVHGPLLATLMLDLLVTSLPECQLQYFEFKAMQPVFDLHPFDVCCDTPGADGKARLWIRDYTGALCMNGSAILRTD